jgi:hypothetical protein
MSVHPARNTNVETGRVNRYEQSVVTDLRNWKQEYQSHWRQPCQSLGKIHDNEGVFYKDHKPLLNLLTIMGVMPLQKTKTGTLIKLRRLKIV